MHQGRAPSGLAMKHRLLLLQTLQCIACSCELLKRATKFKEQHTFFATLNHLLIFDALLIDDALGDWIHCSHKGTSIPASCIDRTARKCIHKHKLYKLSSASTKTSKGTQTHLVFASFHCFLLQCKQEQQLQIFVLPRFIYLQSVYGNLHCKQKILVASTKISYTS